MPFEISMKIDGGLESYKIGLTQLSTNIKSFRKLWEMVINYFEGKDILFNNTIAHKDGSTTVSEKKLNVTTANPILKLWESEGKLIGASWTNTITYENWKSASWERAKMFTVPISSENEQVLTGKQLNALLNKDNTNAVRVIEDMAMSYGVDLDYSEVWQEKKRILDFYPGMLEDLNKLVAAFIRNCAALEFEGDGL